MIRTRVFELAPSYGYTNLEKLATATSVSIALLSRIRAGQVKIGELFITGALRAFPDKKFDDLFELVEDGPAPAEKESAEVAG